MNMKVGVGAIMLATLGFAVAANITGPDDAVKEANSPEAKLPVQVAHLDLATYASDLRALATKGVAAVRAVAETKSQETYPNDPDLVDTRQEFRTVETYWGTPDATFTVVFTGGIVNDPDGQYLLEVEGFPQFEQGKEYLLVLAPRSTDTAFFVFGGSQGRYQIVDGRLQAVAASADQDVERQLGGRGLDEAIALLKQLRSQRP